MQFKKLLFFIISISVIFSACDSKTDAEQQNEKQTETKKEVVQKKETKFVLTTQDSQMINMEIKEKGVDFKELKGKVVLLNFFAVWCPPCKAEIPHLVNLKNKYKDSFEVVAINLGDRSGKMTSTENMEAFIKDYNINYIVSNTEKNYQVSDSMGGISTIPTMFLIDTEGKTMQKYVGIVPEEMIETDIKKALGK